jgi:hypothetical protein
MNQMHPDLVRLGNELECAIGQQLTAADGVRQRGWLRSRVTVAFAVTGGIVAVGGAAAAAVSVLSAETVAHRLPGSADIFEGTDPSCTTTDNVVFDCALPQSPLGGKTVAAGLDDYFDGYKVPFVDDTDHVAGGCIGQDGAGLHWICYAGQRAIDEDIIGPLVLGEPLDGPSGG